LITCRLFDDARVTHDHAQHDGAAGRGGHQAHRPSITQQFNRVLAQLQGLGELMATVSEEIDRLKADVSNHIDTMRAKVTSLQSQIDTLTGQVSTAATDQMTTDAQALSDSLDQIEQAFASDSPAPAPAPATPADPGTPAARR
jgi:hypothetical protein